MTGAAPADPPWRGVGPCGDEAQPWRFGTVPAGAVDVGGDPLCEQRLVRIVPVPG